MNATVIYHICSQDSWDAQSTSNDYLHDSLQKEGFIHCSKQQQIEGVLDRYFKNQQDLLILHIQSNKLKSKLQYDKAPIGEYFPHVYGPINKDAIIEIKKIRESV